MSNKFLLVASDESDRKQGEISVLDAAHETERLVETLLEAGLDQERIRVFTGSEAEFVTTYRPVVSLADETNQTTAPVRPESDQVEPEATEVDANGSSMSSLFRSARDEKHAISAFRRGR